MGARWNRLQAKPIVAALAEGPRRRPGFLNLFCLTDAFGFTLIEVMVALAILAGLSLLTTQALRTGFTNKKNFQAEISKESLITDALRVMQNDVAAAFHHRDFNVTMVNELVSSTPAQQNQQNQKSPEDTSGEEGQPASQSPSPPTGQQLAQVLGTPRPTPVQLTAFIGDGDSMHFTTTSHIRTIRDSKESDIARIGYYLKSCKSTHPRNRQATQCLYRSESPYLDEDVTKEAPESVLLENVTEFKLRYFGPQRDEYVDVWKTGRDGDPISKNNFPYAVEITLTVHDQSDREAKPFSQTVLAPIRFPNNPPLRQRQGG